ncbi:MAG: VOC family protein [Actinomycetota bacterium]
MVIGLHHVGRAVTDLATTSAQLAALSGWPVERLDGPDDPLVAGRRVLATARAAGPNGWIELVQVAGDPPERREVNEAGVTHAAVQLPRIEATLDGLDAAGIERHPGPLDLGTGYRYLYVRDAERLVTEIEGAPHAPADLDPWLSHGAIATPDLRRLRAAYEHLLATDAKATTRLRGIEPFDRGTMLDGVDVTASWVPVANGSVEMWQYHHPATEPADPVDYETPGSGHLAFESDDLSADLARALAAGFTTADEPIATGGVEIARLRDLDGNWVELLAFDDESDHRSLRRRPDLTRPDRIDALLTSGR